ncbi:MAG: alpha/beta fold hydrolase [Moraxella sp.]|nr:alpha/beta fold hydrolase [Moraxella sp.]
MTQPILSSNGVHRLHHTFFYPLGDIKATLLIVHGMCEHSGRYAEFAQFLADNGILVATYDQLGHGQTAKDMNELGFIDEKHPVQALCKDMVIMADKLKTFATDVPHFVMGHSMGSLVVRTVLAHHASQFTGAIIMGTGNGVGMLGTLASPALALLNTLYPKLKNERLAWGLNQYMLNQIRSPISASPFAWLAENVNAVKAFEADPLCGFTFTNNGFIALYTLMKKATQDSWYQSCGSDFGVLLVSGKDDPVGNMGVDVALLHDKLLRHQIATTSLLYPNMRHEPLHELNKEQVYQDVLSWLNARIAKA